MSDDFAVGSAGSRTGSEPAPVRTGSAVRAPVRGEPNREPVRRGRLSRRKGKTWERELAALLRPALGAHIKRGLQSRCGRDGCDVEGTAFWIEAKHHHLVDVRAALRQALAATDGRPAVVVAKDGKKPPGWRPGQPGAAPLVVMRLEDWLALVGRLEPTVVRSRPELPAAHAGEEEL